MAKPQSKLKLRPAALEDAGITADLDTARAPDDPRDGTLLAFWWSNPPAGEKSYRLIAEENGAAIAFVGAGHGVWADGEHRFGWVRIALHPHAWSDSSFRDGVDAGESWLRSEGAQTSTTRVRADFTRDLGILAALGYREVRRTQVSHLDLARGRARLLAAADKARAEMKRQGVLLMTLDQDHDPDGMRKLYELDLQASDDVPKTVPWPVPTFEEWRRSWFGNPGHRPDRFWIAREADAIVGLSCIGYPPHRGFPWTSFTATARSARGRGIARALKYETVAQAIALGAERVDTHSDAENAAILHLNREMGYEPTAPIIELHRRLGA